MKELVYRANSTINNVEELMQKFLSAVQQIKETLKSRVTKTENGRDYRNESIKNRDSHFEQNL